MSSMDEAYRDAQARAQAFNAERTAELVAQAAAHGVKYTPASSRADLKNTRYSECFLDVKELRLTDDEIIERYIKPMLAAVRQDLVPAPDDTAMLVRLTFAGRSEGHEY
jgi:hypothetical protein